jgi:outer membrane receptor protein involved in Fe transport
MHRPSRLVFLVAVLGTAQAAAAPLTVDTTKPPGGETSATVGEPPPPPATGEPEEQPATAEAPPADESSEVEDLKLIDAITVETKRLSEELVYSVTRTPQRTFDTPRAVQVITAEQIRRKAGFELSDVLMQESGFFISPGTNGGGSVIVRGLASRQVLVMIDGVKLNNSTWRTFSDVKEHFNLIDPSEIERIEVVRGLVSVLGSEALGGVVNIITKKGPDEAKPFGFDLTTRYSSADEGMAAALQIHGRGERYRYIGGLSGVNTDDLTSGGGIEQANTAYERRSGHVHFDYFPSSEKTLSIGYRAFERSNKYLTFTQSPLISDADVDPMRMQMATMRYDDVTARPWQDSLAVTASWNRQDDGRNYVVRTPVVHTYYDNSDSMLGLNVELGKFLGPHHLVYGIDHTRETIRSSTVSYLGAGRVAVGGRGDYLDGGEYDATALYLNDQFELGSRLTITAGARYGRYVSRGSETLPVIGHFDARSERSNVTSSLNVVYHATPTLNVVGNYVRGYRPPNMHDMTSGSSNGFFAFVPTTALEAERMNSIEGGVKYDSGRVSGSAFYFENELSNVLVNGLGSFDGKPYLDYNGNDRQNVGEPFVLVTTNVGRATVKGYELDLRYLPTASLTVWGNYARTVGTNNDSRQSLSRIQPRLANAGARFAARGDRHLWVEAVFTYASESEGTDGTRFPGFDVYTLRGGLDLGDRLSLTLAVENLLDEQYRYSPSIALLDQPGRQAVVVTELRF